MRYRLGRPDYRRFDACYYLIQTDVLKQMEMMDGTSAQEDTAYFYYDDGKKVSNQVKNM